MQIFTIDIFLITLNILATELIRMDLHQNTLFIFLILCPCLCMCACVCVCLCVLKCIVSMTEQADKGYFILDSLIHPPALDCSDALRKNVSLKSLFLCLHIFFSLLSLDLWFPFTSYFVYLTVFLSSLFSWPVFVLNRDLFWETPTVFQSSVACCCIIIINKSYRAKWRNYIKKITIAE